MRYHQIIAAEAASEAGTVEPIKPLTPAQQRRRQMKNTATEKRIRDQQATSAQKLADLRAKLV